MTREEAIERIRDHMIVHEMNEPRAIYISEALSMAINALEQEPKTGHWEWVQYDSNPNIGNWHCSECNRIVCGAIKYAYKYCPQCGARMESEEEE